MHWSYSRPGPATQDRTADDHVARPVVVCSAISCDEFLCWLESDDNAPLRWQYEPRGVGGGQVVMYSPPTAVHTRTAHAIAASIQRQVAQLGQDGALLDALRSPVSLVCRLGDQLQAPDGALVPADARKDRLPTLVVEIAYTNETLATLQTRMAHWVHSDGVQVAVGVKIYTSLPTTLTLVVMQPRAAVQFVDAGGTGESPAWRRRPTVATFPLGALFRGFALPSPLQPHARALIAVDAEQLCAVVQHAQRAMVRP